MHLIMLAKAPILGFVKTRLAREIGDEAALELYRWMLQSLHQSLQESGYSYEIAYTPLEGFEATREALGGESALSLQGEGDLGAKMEQALRDALSHHSKALLIGSDTPTLTPELFRRVDELLQNHEIVIGPAKDGGYYLIAFTQEGFMPELFHAMPWSTSLVLQETLQRARGKRVALLEEREDIDTLETLARAGF